MVTVFLTIIGCLGGGIKKLKEYQADFQIR